MRPCSVNSVPIFCACSNPLMSWQPKQPYLAMTFFPSSAMEASCFACPWPNSGGSGYFASLLSVTRNAVTLAASSSDSRRSGIFVSGHIALGFFTQL